jgi:hypothetical protein
LCREFNKEFIKEFNKELNKEFNKELNKELNKDFNKTFNGIDEPMHSRQAMLPLIVKWIAYRRLPNQWKHCLPGVHWLIYPIKCLIKILIKFLIQFLIKFLI